MAYKDPAKKRAAERAYRKNNPEKVKAQEAEGRKRMKEFKQQILSSISLCKLCGEADIDLIDWHHIDPAQKETTVSNWYLSYNAWWNEVMKCIPVCVSCHRKIHKQKLCLIPQKR